MSKGSEETLVDSDEMSYRVLEWGVLIGTLFGIRE